MSRKILTFMAMLGIAAWICGCGGGGSDAPQLGEVSGTITLDGKPAANVNVVFQPENGRPAMATTDTSGAYTLKYLDESGTKVGKNLVSINSPEPDGDGCGGCEEFLDPIPPKYNSEASDNPEMTVDVKPGSQEFNFDLKSDPNARRSAGCGNSGKSNTCED
jgi:hypothetical protein